MSVEYTVRALTGEDLRRHIPALARILHDCVEGGASVSFMSPFTQQDAEAFFNKCADSAERGGRVILAAFDPAGTPAGTVQLILDMPPNQPHRADVSKLLVHRSARNHGLAARLMQAVEEEALKHNRTLLVLDTITGSTAERLYTRLGWTAIGSIPEYALMPDGTGPFATTVFWKKVASAMKTLALIAVLATSAWSQVARDANREYATPEDRAKLVPRLENPDRLARIRPSELVRQLDIKPGSTVVDLGSGTGTLLKALSDAVGPKGRVISEDIFADFQDRARARAKSENLTNVDFILGTDTDPRLPERKADLVVILDAYHHFDHPEKMLAAIHRSLKPGGRLAIVEYHKLRGAMEVAGDPDFAIRHVRAAAEQVEKEVTSAKYRLLWRREHAPGSQYIAMFRKN